MGHPSGVFFMATNTTQPPLAKEDIWKLLQGEYASASQKSGLAQRLRDERLTAGNQLRQEFAPLWDNSDGVYGGSPIDSFTRETAKDRAYIGMAESAMKDIKDPSDILMKLYQLAQEDEKIKQSGVETTTVKPPTYADQQKADESGKTYEQQEDGSWALRDKKYDELSEEEKKSYAETRGQLETILGSGYDSAYRNLKGSYGGLSMANTPGLNLLSRGTTKNAKSALKAIIAKAELGTSKDMKGQGAVSNLERQIIAKAATELNNPDLTEDRAIQLLMEMEMALATESGEKSKYADSYAKKFGSSAVSSFLGYGDQENQLYNAATSVFNPKVEVDKYW